MSAQKNMDQSKAEFNARAKAAMREYLKSRSWPEKIRSIERMNEAGKIAREAMKRARQSKAAGSSRGQLDAPAN